MKVPDLCFSSLEFLSIVALNFFSYLTTESSESLISESISSSWSNKNTEFATDLCEEPSLKKAKYIV